jgi:hypothetical protein
MMNEQMFLNMMMGGGLNGSGWINAVMAAALFAVLIFQPKAIVRPGQFRVACWIFGVSLVAPTLVTLIQIALGSMGGGGRFGSSMGDPSALLVMLLPPLLLAASFVLAADSLIPRRQTETRHSGPMEPPGPPPAHLVPPPREPGR